MRHTVRETAEFLYLKWSMKTRITPFAFHLKFEETSGQLCVGKKNGNLEFGGRGRGRRGLSAGAFLAMNSAQPTPLPKSTNPTGLQFDSHFG
jgi:hypothetical protein